MIAKIRSTWIVLVIFFQKIIDNVHRLIFGLPRLKRSQITAEVFLGSQYNKVGLKKLKKLGVTAIVNMRIHSVYPNAQFKGFKYLHLPTIDNTPPPMEDLIKGADFIDQEIKHGGKVYIHCRQGLGRGPTMTLAYLLKKGLTFDDALAMVKGVRPFIDPRPEQIQRLKELEKYYSPD
jgi:protein-tyrosine phosphatase